MTKKNYEISSRTISSPQAVSDILSGLEPPLDTLLGVLNAASEFLDLVEAFILDLEDPQKNLFLQLLEEARNILKAFRDAGVYSIFIPPPVNEVRSLVESYTQRADALQMTVDEQRGFSKSTVDSFVDFTDPYQFVPGGMYRVQSLLTNAFRDINDANRPVFSESGSQMGGLVLFVDGGPTDMTNLLQVWLSLLGSLIGSALSAYLDVVNPPDFNIKNANGRVELSWQDPSALVPPVAYEVVRSEFPEGDKIPTVVTTDTGESVQDFLRDSDGFVTKYKIIKTVSPVEDFFKDLYEVSDTTGDLGKPYFYGIRKNFGPLKESGYARSDDPAAGPVSSLKIGIALEGITLKNPLPLEITFGEKYSSIDRPFTNKQPEVFKIPTLTNLSLAVVQGPGLFRLPRRNGKIEIGDEIMYYKSISPIGDYYKLEGLLRAREGTIVTKHSVGSPVDILGVYTNTTVGTEPNFLPPIKVSTLIPPLGDFIDTLLALLTSISEGFLSATGNIRQYIDSQQQRIDALIRDLERLKALLDSLDLGSLGITVSAVFYPVKAHGTEGMVERINQSFSDPNFPETNFSNVASAFGIFWAGPQASAISQVIDSILVKV